MSNTENNITETPADDAQGDETTANDSESTDTETNPADGTQGTENTEGNDTTEPTGKNKSGREAAKYRTQLRATETERDQLSGQLENAREIILNNHLSSERISLRAGGIQKLGYNTAELMNDDLTINADALASTLQNIEKDGFTFKPQSSPVPKSGTGNYSPESKASWGNVLGNND